MKTTLTIISILFSLVSYNLYANDFCRRDCEDQASDYCAYDRAADVSYDTCFETSYWACVTDCRRHEIILEDSSRNSCGSSCSGLTGDAKKICLFCCIYPDAAHCSQPVDSDTDKK